MKIECTVEELKELLKKEHSDCSSECFIDRDNGSLVFKNCQKSQN